MLILALFFRFFVALCMFSTVSNTIGAFWFLSSIEKKKFSGTPPKLERTKQTLGAKPFLLISKFFLSALLLLIKIHKKILLWPSEGCLQLFTAIIFLSFMTFFLPLTTFAMLQQYSTLVFQKAPKMLQQNEIYVLLLIVLIIVCCQNYSIQV